MSASEPWRPWGCGTSPSVRSARRGNSGATHATEPRRTRVAIQTPGTLPRATHRIQTHSAELQPRSYGTEGHRFESCRARCAMFDSSSRSGDTGRAMSQENVEVVLEGVDALNRRDPDAFIGCVHPDVVWEVSGEVSPYLQGIYRGRAEVRGWFEKSVLEIWQSFHAEVEEITETNDGQVFLGVLVTARGR